MQLLVIRLYVLRDICTVCAKLLISALFDLFSDKYRNEFFDLLFDRVLAFYGKETLKQLSDRIHQRPYRGDAG